MEEKGESDVKLEVSKGVEAGKPEMGE